uniref:Uncharacterized protein n=1 Tax=viral metagenome TaxID=1070528 RepID=A0A6C0CIW0_9ZZZZ
MDVDTLKIKCKGLSYDYNITKFNCEFVICHGDYCNSSVISYFSIIHKCYRVDNQFYNILESFCKYLGYSRLMFRNIGFDDSTDIYLQP